LILAVTGVQGPPDAALVEAALKRRDPTIRLWTDWPRGCVAIQSAASAKSLCAAVQGAGYGVLVQRADGRPAGRGSIGGILGRMLLYAVLGAVLGVAVGVVIGLGNSLLNPDCSRPGSSGNCAIGVGVFGFLLGAIGLPVGVLAGLIHGLIRRHG
jgi:hypothetical protein